MKRIGSSLLISLALAHAWHLGVAAARLAIARRYLDRTREVALEQLLKELLG